MWVSPASRVCTGDTVSKAVSAIRARARPRAQFGKIVARFRYTPDCGPVARDETRILWRGAAAPAPRRAGPGAGLGGGSTDGATPNSHDLSITTGVWGLNAEGRDEINLSLV